MAEPFERLGVDRNASAAQIRRAYLGLVRKWHPDRFLAGPERLLAEKNMIEINIAYDEAMGLCSGLSDAEMDEEILLRARMLIQTGEITAARRVLSGAVTRCAEWNYLFGEVQMRLGDIKKAALYYGVATRQRPEVSIYKTAQAKALSALKASKPLSFFRKR